MVSHSSQSDESDSSIPKISLSEKPFFPKRANKFTKGDHSDTMDDDLSHSSHEQDGEEKLKYRTELCKFYEINGQCKFGDKCIFAHGKENLREKVLTKSGYKKRACINFFEHGFCMYGNRCQFSHEIKATHCKEYFSYKKLLKDITKLNFESNVVEEIKEKPRLNVFKKISKGNNRRKAKKKKPNDLDYINDIIKLCDDEIKE